MTFLLSWLRQTPRRTAARPTNRRSCRLQVEPLEHRTLLSAGFHHFGGMEFGGFGEAAQEGQRHQDQTPGPATHLDVIVPENVTSGNSFDVLVEAQDASNHLASGYSGTVHFTLGTADAGATLPADYTFTASDHGKHEFHVTLAATGSQTITATDTATGSITGQAALTVDAAGAVTHFGVYALGRALAGSPTPVLVVALDAANHAVANYTGTVHFTSNDAQATLPADYTFTASDNGSHLFSVTFVTAGKQSLTATDTATSSITGSVTDRIFAQLARRHW